VGPPKKPTGFFGYVPGCLNPATGTNDEAILHDMVKSLLPALGLKFEASKWQGQGLKCQDQGQGQCHDYQDQGPHCQV